MNSTLSRSAAQMFLEQDGALARGSAYRGHLERLDADIGLQGWVAGAMPDNPPDLELRIDGITVATCSATGHRSDIWTPSDASTLSGFVFSLDELVKHAARSDFSPDARVLVGPVGTSDCLTSKSKWTFSDLQLLLVSDVQADIEIGIGLDMPAELRRLAILARRAFMQPARQDSRKRLGVIEFLAPLPGNGFIVGGWMEDNSPRTFATVLVAEGRKFAGGFSCVMRMRSDLPNGMQAFVGILLLDDKLNFQKTPQLSMHLAGASGRWLGSLQPLRIIEAKAAFTELQQAISASTDARAKEIEQFVRDSLPWGAVGTELQGHSVKVGLDDCVVAPGFGVFIRGWILSATGVIVDLTARIGDAVFHLDPGSLTTGAREDLGTVFPDYGDRVGGAAVTALLRGVEQPDPHTNWLLRIRFNNGLMHTHEIAVDRTRSIDLFYDLNRLQIIYPGFAASVWLPELVDSLYGMRAIKQHSDVHWEQKLTCKSAFIIAIPPHRSHQAISLDSFDRHIGGLPPSTGAVLMVPSSMPPGIAANWVNSISARHPKISIGVCRLGNNAHHWPALWTVLEHCGIQNFVYVGPKVLLTDAGAKEAARLLSSPSAGPVFFAVESVRSGNPQLVYETSAFSWTSSDLCAHAATSIALVDYAWRDNAIAGGAKLHAKVGRAHGLHIGPHMSPLIELINNRMFSQKLAARAAEKSATITETTTILSKRPILIRGAAI